MRIYIDSEFKCHVSPGDGFRNLETHVFDGYAPGYIEGYRFVPTGESWTREDGVVFQGEMVSPWKSWRELDGIQREYKREQYQEITAQNAELVDAMAAMVEDVYASDIAEIEEG